MIRTPRVRPAHVIAVATLVLACLSPAAASAQSLIVNMTAPAPDALLRGSTPVSAQVTIVGLLIVGGVQFKLDNANLGAEDPSAPYSISWNTTTASNGPHSVKAVARDILGGQWTSNTISVTVDNAPPNVTINQASGQADPTRNSPVNFTVAFSESVSGFTNADVGIAGTAGGTKTVTVTGGP